MDSSRTVDIQVMLALIGLVVLVLLLCAMFMAAFPSGRSPATLAEWSRKAAQYEAPLEQAQSEAGEQGRGYRIYSQVSEPPLLRDLRDLRLRRVRECSTHQGFAVFLRPSRSRRYLRLGHPRRCLGWARRLPLQIVSLRFVVQTAGGTRCDCPSP